MTVLENPQYVSPFDVLEILLERSSLCARGYRASTQVVREFHEDQALSASKRQQAKLPQRGYDCGHGDCKRYFDSELGRDLHYRRQHPRLPKTA